MVILSYHGSDAMPGWWQTGAKIRIIGEKALQTGILFVPLQRINLKMKGNRQMKATVSVQDLWNQILALPASTRREPLVQAGNT